MTDPTPEDVERGAEVVHRAYLATANRLGMNIRREMDQPYAALPENAKELDRATYRAAAMPDRSALIRELRDALRSGVGFILALLPHEGRPPVPVFQSQAQCEAFEDICAALRKANEALGEKA